MYGRAPLPAIARLTEQCAILAGHRSDDPAEPARLLTRWLERHPVDLEEIPAWLRLGDPSTYARHRLHLCPVTGFVVYLMVWQPGQATPIHDHDGAWGVIGCLEGRLTVTDYERLDDRSTPGRARLDALGTTTLEPHQSGRTWFPDREIHRIANPGPEPAASLHVYSRDLLEYREFDLATDTCRIRTLEPTTALT